MGEAAEQLEEQPYYPIEVRQDEQLKIITEVYLVTESDQLLWLLDRCPLGVRVWIDEPERQCKGVALKVSKADIRRFAADIARMLPKVTLQTGTLYIDAVVLS